MASLLQFTFHPRPQECFQLINICNNGVSGVSANGGAHRINQIIRQRPYCLDKNYYQLTPFGKNCFQENKKNICMAMATNQAF